MSVNLKKKHHKKKFETKVESLLKEHLEETDAVTEVKKGNKRSSCYKCPECKNIIIEKFSRHLEISHKYTHYDATMLQSKMRVMYLWCRAEKHGQNLPLPCKSCGQWQTRLDQHLALNVAHQLFTKQEEIEKIVNGLSKECWEKGLVKKKMILKMQRVYMKQTMTMTMLLLLRQHILLYRLYLLLVTSFLPQQIG